MGTIVMYNLANDHARKVLGKVSW